MKIKLLVLTLLGSLYVTGQSPIASSWQEVYWKTRNNPTNSFCVIGNDNEQSMPGRPHGHRTPTANRSYPYEYKNGSLDTANQPLLTYPLNPHPR